MSGAHTKLQLVLVHGTWGRGFFWKRKLAQWCEPDSQFRSDLVASLRSQMPELQLHFSAFNWDGRNSIHSRADASIQLADELAGHSMDGSPVLVIAHSHGGNVALLASMKMECCSKIHICTLATPFLRLVENTKTIKYSKAVFCVGSMIVLLACFFACFRWLPLPTWVPRPKPVYPLLACFAAIIAFGGWLGISLDRLIVNPHTGTTIWSAWANKPRRLAEATAWDTSILGDRLLVLRGVDDEASLSLAAGAIVNRVLNKLYAISITIATAALVYGSSPAIAYDEYFLRALLITIPVAFLLLLAPALIRPIFGREMAFGTSRCDAMYDSAPDGDRSKIVTLHSPSEAEKLNHAIYEHPEAPRQIAAWIASKLKDSRASTG
ncbi:alpha/beta fold hydrolase [Bradyrhizobium sp.]